MLPEFYSIITSPSKFLNSLIIFTVDKTDNFISDHSQHLQALILQSFTLSVSTWSISDSSIREHEHRL